MKLLQIQVPQVPQPSNQLFNILPILKWQSSKEWQASLVAQTVNNLSAVQEIQVQFLGWEDPLEKRMATHSSILT